MTFAIKSCQAPHQLLGRSSFLSKYFHTQNLVYAILFFFLNEECMREPTPYVKTINSNKIIELPPSACCFGMPKANAWILWLIDKKGLIIDLKVYEVIREDEFHREKVYEYIKMRMGGTPYLDIGNCCSDWEKWTLENIFFKFGIQNKFKSRKILIRSLERLSVILEWEQSILKYLRQLR